MPELSEPLKIHFTVLFILLQNVPGLVLHLSGRIDPLQPNLPPKRIETSRAEEPIRTEFSPTDDILKNDAVARKLNHFSRLLIDDLLDPLRNFKLTATIINHFDVEPQSAISLLLIQGRNHLISRLDLNQLSRLEI